MAFRDTGLSIDATPEKSSGLVGNRGTPIVHEIGVKCPCVQMEGEGGLAGQPDPNCELCLGSSYLYRDPINTIGLITNMTANRFWSMVSWVQAGDLMLSPSPDYRRISDFDRITIQLPVPFDDLVIKRGTVTAVSPRPTGIKDHEDVLYWEAARTEASWIEDQNGVVYRVGDYLLQGRKIVWVGKQPAVGIKYTVKYEAYPEYVAWTTPVDRFDRDRLLGQRVMLRKAVIALDAQFKKLREDFDKVLSDQNPFNSEDVYDHYGETFDRKLSPRR